MKRKLKVWIIRASEALPIDKSGKLMRAGLLADYLAKQGHDVTWWTTTFIHGEKRYRFDEQKVIDVNEHEKLVLLHSPYAYQKNISLARIRYYRRLAKEFQRNCERFDIPDIIVSAYPTVEFAEVAEQYGKKHQVPVILDVRDLWPDIFAWAFPDSMKWLSKIALFPLKCQTSRVFREATGITGVVPQSLQWGLNYAHRKKQKWDRCIYIACQRKALTEEVLQENLDYWSEFGITCGTWNICFIGTLSSKSLDLTTVIKAASSLMKKHPDMRLVICGAGDAEIDLKKLAGDNSNIVFPGWLGEDRMRSLMKISKCGMYCYKNHDFRDAFGNKIIQYMSEGLPVVSSLEGFSCHYIQKYAMGTLYSEGDAESCARSIEKLYLDEDGRKDMAQNSLKCFEKDFDTEVVNRQFEMYLKDMVNVFNHNKVRN